MGVLVQFNTKIKKMVIEGTVNTTETNNRAAASRCDPKYSLAFNESISRYVRITAQRWLKKFLYTSKEFYTASSAALRCAKVI